MTNSIINLHLHPDFIDTLSRASLSDRDRINKSLDKIKLRQWDGGLRVKLLKGFRRRVWEARIGSGDRLIFFLSEAVSDAPAHVTDLYVLDVVDHDHVNLTRRRDYSLLAKFLLEVDRPEVLLSESEVSDINDGSVICLDDGQTDAAKQVPSREELLHYLSDLSGLAGVPVQPHSADLWLTEDQMEAALGEGNAIVAGTAGSGKTSIVVQRMILYNSDAQMLDVACNERLVEHARRLFEEALPPSLARDSTYKSRFHFATFDTLLKGILGVRSESFPDANLVRFPEFLSVYSHWREKEPAAIVWGEIRSIIKGANIDRHTPLLPKNIYLSLGSKRAPDLVDGREDVHRIAQHYQAWLTKKGLHDEADVCRAALEKAKAGPPDSFGLIVCDEAQDLTELQIELLFLLLHQTGSVLFAGDVNQMINPSGFRWAEVVDLFARHRLPKPTTYVFEENFRSTEAIIALADGVLRFRWRTLAKTPAVSHSASTNPGQRPKVVDAPEMNVMRLIGNMDASFAVLVHSPEEKRRIKSRTSFDLVFTIEEAKGLEFDNLLVWDFFSWERRLWNKALTGSVPKPMLPSLKYIFNLLYVAVTRAKQSLFLFDPALIIQNMPELAKLCDISPPEVMAETVQRTVLSPEQARGKGNYYFAHEFYEEAASCYRQANDESLIRMAEGAAFRRERSWLKAAGSFLRQPDLAAAAEMFEAAKDWDQAAHCYRASDRERDASRCLAHRAVQGGRWAEAADHWRTAGDAKKALQCIQKTTDNATANRYRAEFMTEQGNYAEAATIYEKLGEWRRAGENWEQYGRWVASVICYLTLGDLASCDRCRVSATGKSEGHEIDFRVAFARSDWDGAAEVAVRGALFEVAAVAFRKASRNVEADRFDARVAEDRGDLAAALEYWQVLNEPLETARLKEKIRETVHALTREGAGKLAASDKSGYEYFRQALRLTPDDAGLHFIFAELLSGFADTPAELYETIKHYRAATAVKTAADDAVMKGVIKKARQELCTLLFTEGMFQDAVDEFAIYVDEQPDSAVGHCDYGTALEAVGRFEEAYKEWITALALDPSLYQIHFNLGNHYFRSEEFRNSIDFYQEALRIKPDAVEVHMTLSKLYSEVGETDLARAELRRAVNIDPGQALARRALDADLKHGPTPSRIAAALAEAQKYTLLHPDSITSYLTLGTFLGAQKRWSEALGEYANAERRGLRDSILVNKQGIAFFAKGYLHEAIQKFGEALQLDPKDKDAGDNLKILRYQFSPEIESRPADWSAMLESSAPQRYDILPKHDIERILPALTETNRFVE